jgi:hypothetical protein
MKQYINPMTKVIFLALIALIGLSAPETTFAQRAAASKTASGKTRKVTKKKAQEKVDWAKNRERQKGKTMKPAMAFYGLSESLASLVAKGQPEISKENGHLMSEGEEELFEEPTKPLANLLPDPLQTLAGANFSGVLGANFDAVVAGGSAPPDTTLAVGPSHIIVWVNSRYSIYNKTGTLLLGPVNGNTLFTGVGGVCETTNRGDPILQYDRLADRWILSQFAFNVTGGTPSAPYLQCFAVSQTNDPTGAYYRYTVTFSPTSPSGFNDYGKLGVFPDAYYTSYNMFGGSPAGSNTGVGLCASDRAKMLAGDATATTLCAPIAFYAGGASFLPADLDGTTLPTNSTQGGIFIRQNTAPSLVLMKLKPNFSAGTVTLTDGLGGATGSFVSVTIPTTLRACNGTGGTCITQPGTSNTLDTLGSRLMYRAAYRNRSGTDSLVVAQTTDPDGAGTRGGAMRWYEIRSPFAAAPTLHQVGTFDEGGTGNRWMGSVAMNKDGDMMMGYSIVNSATSLAPGTAPNVVPPNTKPSIALTGRRLSDSLNTMQTEQIVFTGTGSQTGTLTRWGDYTTIQVDPTDDQGFCFVGQYLLTDGTFNWRTRVICAKFPPPTAAAVAVSGKVSNAAGIGIGKARVTITAGDGSVRTVLTNPFGKYRFDDVFVGETYVVSVSAKGYTFINSSRVVQVEDTIDDLDFTAD